MSKYKKKEQETIITSSLTVCGNADINRFQKLLDNNSYLLTRCSVEVNDKVEYVIYTFTSHSTQEYNEVTKNLKVLVRLFNYEL